MQVVLPDSERTGESSTSYCHWGINWPADGPQLPVVEDSAVIQAAHSNIGGLTKLRDFLKNVYCVHRQVRRDTVHDFNTTLNSLERFLERVSVLSDLTEPTLEGFTNWLAERNRSRATVNKNLRNLKALARMARRKRLIEYVPDIVMLQEKRRRPDSLKAKEVDRLITAIRKQFKDSFYGLVLRAIVYVIYDTALRLGDVVRLRRSDLDLETRVIRLVEQKTDKPRSFVLHERTIAAIEKLHEQLGYSDRLLNYEFVTTTPLRDRIRLALAAAQLPFDRKSLFQKLRRTVATLGKSAGFDPTEILDHSAKWVTDTYYVDRSDPTPMDIATKLPALDETLVGDCLAAADISPEAVDSPAATTQAAGGAA